MPTGVHLPNRSLFFVKYNVKVFTTKSSLGHGQWPTLQAAPLPQLPRRLDQYNSNKRLCLQRQTGSCITVRFLIDKKCRNHDGRGKCCLHGTMLFLLERDQWRKGKELATRDLEWDHRCYWALLGLDSSFKINIYLECTGQHLGDASIAHALKAWPMRNPKGDTL